MARTLVELVSLVVGVDKKLHGLEVAEEVEQSSGLDVASFGEWVFSGAFENLPDSLNVIDSLFDPAWGHNIGGALQLLSEAKAENDVSCLLEIKGIWYAS